LKILRCIPSLESLNKCADGVKSGAITLMAVGAASITGVGVMNAVTSNSVMVEAIKVPAPFEERGYNSDITTARLLDEIAILNRKSTAGKERVSIFGKNGQDDLGKLQASVSGLDVKRIQEVIQDMLGVKQERITGEITFKKEADHTFYNVRLRRLPANEILVDVKVKGEPDDVLKKTALAMLEVFDPVIAAGNYSIMGDRDNTLRVIDLVLSDEKRSDYKNARNMMGYIHIREKNYAAAQEDFNKIMSIDPKFAPAHGMASWLYRDKGDYSNSLIEADKAIDFAPKKWWGYIQKAHTLKSLNRLDDAGEYYKKTIALKPDAPGPYVQAGLFFASKDNPLDAMDSLRKGLALFPENALLHAHYGTLLKKQGVLDRAAREFDTALEIDPKNTTALTGKKDLIATTPK
jgi:tetratricopeptide (TPR) repeat protein